MDNTHPDPIPTRRIGGRPWRRLVAYVLTRDRGICHLCGHPGADTGDHLTPLEAGGPELDPANVKAAHGTRRTLEHHGYDCPGNYAHTTRTPPPRSTPPSRTW